MIVISVISNIMNVISNIHLPYCHVSNCALFST